MAEEKAVPEQLSLEMYVGFWNLSKHFLLQQTRYHWVPHRLTWGRSDSYPEIVKKGPQGTPEKELTSGTTRIGISYPQPGLPQSVPGWLWCMKLVKGMHEEAQASLGSPG